jgi:hypothetical protein
MGIVMRLKIWLEGGCYTYSKVRKMTESQSRPCVLDQTSDVRQVLDLIADKWTALIILSLSRNTRRYGELHHPNIQVGDRSPQ